MSKQLFVWNPGRKKGSDKKDKKKKKSKKKKHIVKAVVAKPAAPSKSSSSKDEPKSSSSKGATEKKPHKREDFTKVGRGREQKGRTKRPTFAEAAAGEGDKRGISRYTGLPKTLTGSLEEHLDLLRQWNDQGAPWLKPKDWRLIESKLADVTLPTNGRRINRLRSVLEVWNDNDRLVPGHKLTDPRYVSVLAVYYPQAYSVLGAVLANSRNTEQLEEAKKKEPERTPRERTVRKRLGKLNAELQLKTIAFNKTVSNLRSEIRALQAELNRADFSDEEESGEEESSGAGPHISEVESNHEDSGHASGSDGSEGDATEDGEHDKLD